MMNWDFIQSMFRPRCSWNMIPVHLDELQIHHDYYHDKADYIKLMSAERGYEFKVLDY